MPPGTAITLQMGMQSLRCDSICCKGQSRHHRRARVASEASPFYLQRKYVPAACMRRRIPQLQLTSFPADPSSVRRFRRAEHLSKNCAHLHRQGAGLGGHGLEAASQHNARQTWSCRFSSWGYRLECARRLPCASCAGVGFKCRRSSKVLDLS